MENEQITLYDLLLAEDDPDCEEAIKVTRDCVIYYLSSQLKKDSKECKRAEDALSKYWNTKMRIITEKKQDATYAYIEFNNTHMPILVEKLLFDC